MGLTLLEMPNLCKITGHFQARCMSNIKKSTHERGGYPTVMVTMLDLDCKQTLVHQTLVRAGALLEAEWVEVRCVPWVIHKCPIVSL